MLVALVAGMGIFAVRNREQVVQSLPGAARLYAAAGTPVNVHGLEFRNVSTEWIMEDGRATVEVRGEINNITSKVQKIPSLVVGLRDEEGTELCNWRGSTVLDRLAPGNVTRFSVRIPAPQEAVGTALVRFAKKP